MRRAADIFLFVVASLALAVVVAAIFGYGVEQLTQDM